MTEDEWAPRSACENQKPPGRPAELNYQENTVARGSQKDTASICHTLTAGKRVQGGVAAENGEKAANWKREQATIDCEVSKTLKMYLNKVMLFYGQLYNLIIYKSYAELSLRHCIFIIIYQTIWKDFYN